MQQVTRRESDRGNATWFGEPCARAVTRVPDDTSFVVSSHIHYGIPMDQVDTTKEQLVLLPGPETKYLEIAIDFVESLRYEYVRSQMAANDELARFMSTLKKCYPEAGGGELSAESLLSGELGEGDPALIYLGGVLRELDPSKKPQRRRGGGNNDEEETSSIDFPAFKSLKERYELCYRLSKEQLTVVNEMVQSQPSNEGVMGEGVVYVKSFYICTPGDDSVDGRTTWDDVFGWMVEGNPMLPKVEDDGKKQFKGKATKADKAEPKEEVDLRVQLGLDTRRDTSAGCVKNGTLDYIELVAAYYRDGQTPALLRAQTPEARQVLYTANGYPQKGMGPWHSDWIDCAQLYNLTLGNVFSHTIAKGMRTKDTSSGSFVVRPRYPGQMNWEAYLMPELRENSAMVHQLLQEQGSDPHRRGVDYLAAFGGDEAACNRNCFREVNPHLLTPWSHIDALSFPYVWRNLDDLVKHTTSGTYVQMAENSIFSVQDSNIHRVNDHGLRHIHAHIVQSASRAHMQDGEEMIDLTETPIDPISASVGRRNTTNSRIVERLRSEELDHETFLGLCASVMPPGELNKQAARTMFATFRFSRRICRSAKAVIEYGLLSENGLCGDRPNRAYLTRSVAPDMPIMCNAMQKKMLWFEMLGTACLHPIMLLLWQSVLVAMMMHDGIYTNILLYGSHALGKSYAVFMMKKLMIAGSLVEEQESTDKAHRNMQPASFFQVTAMHELGGSGMTGSRSKNGKPQEGEKEKVQVQKNLMTENVCSFVSLLPIAENGRRKMVHVLLKKLGCFWAATNIANLYDMIEHALLSRFIHVPVSDIRRIGSNATDKAGYESLKLMDFETKGEKATAKLAFQHEQWFVAAINALINAGLMAPPTETAFQCILASISKGLSKHGDYTLETRLVQQAQRIATANMYIEVFERCFAREYSIFNDQHRLAPEDLIALEPLLTMSSACALSAIRQVIVPKMCKLEVKSISLAILRWIRENGRYYDMFVVDKPHARRAVDTRDVSMAIDFSYIRFQMDRHKFAHEVVKLNMPNNNKYNSKQIESYLCELFGLGDSGADVESLWSAGPDKPMNVQIREGNNGIAEFWGEEISRAKQMNEGHNVSLEDLKQMEIMWRKNGSRVENGEYGSAYFPFVDIDGGVSCSGMDYCENAGRIPTMVEEKEGSPCVKVSTAWLTHVAQNEWSSIFDSNVSGDIGLSHSTPGFFATSATAGLAVDAQHPYLLTTAFGGMGDKTLKIRNQHYRPAGAHRAIGGQQKRTKYQETENIIIPKGVPLDTYCAVQRANTIVTHHNWFVLPTAHYLFNADWASGANQRLGPYILRLCMDAHPVAFACPDAVYGDCGMTDSDGTNGKDPCPNREERQRIAIDMLKQHVPDFLRHVDPCDPGHREQICYDEASDKEADRFTNELANVVVELSLVARAGMLRVLSRLDSGPVKESVYKNSGLQAHAKREDWQFETFADEWESFFPENELHKTMHYGPGYIDLIRSESRRLWDERERRDGKWLNEWKALHGAC